MCGIAGKVLLDSGEVSSRELKTMADSIAHRGPDDEGIYISNDRKVGLANRRLAIVDLSPKGHQPMFFRNKYVITFNGEIYNHQEERQKLEKMGYKFNSGTDTEVILALYDKYKTGCLKYLRGMFAFAIYDMQNSTLFLARDRLGKKPLKYYFNGNVLIFSSELKALLTQKEVEISPDNVAIHQYLTYGYVPPPLTGFENVFKLEPSHFMFLDVKNKKMFKKRYWDLNFNEKLTLSENEWIERITSELEESTKIRMMTDVPLGALLSGGVDSSTVVALMSRASIKPVKTFTIGFEEKDYDESKYAEIIARKFNTDHTKLVAEAESVETLPYLVKQYEEPFADASQIITYMVSKLARKHVTVIMTGDGGDENFAGYPRFCRFKRDVFLNSYLNTLRPIGIPVTKLLYSTTKSPFWNRMTKFLTKSQLPLADRFVSYNRFLSEEDKINLYTNEFHELTKNINSYDFARNKFSSPNCKDLKDKSLYFEMTAYLPESQLAKVDIATMSASLEARSPFLDQKMVELVAKIPYDLKVSGKCNNKYILKKAVEKLIPKENIYRKKMGFTIPLSKWFTGKLNLYAKSILLSKKSKIKTIIREEEIVKMLMSHKEDNDFGPQLWSLLTLELWLKNYFT